VTRCGHYFCEKCALKRYAKNKGCAVCQEPTNGNFKTAYKILKKMKKMAAIEEKEDDSLVDEKKNSANTGWIIP